MKKTLFSIFFATIIVLILVFVASATSVIDANGNEYYPQDVYFYRQNGNETTINNTFYLPSNTNSLALKVKYDDGSTKTLSLANQLTDSNGNKYYKETLDGTEYSFYFANNLPSVYVTLSITEEALLKDKKKDENVKATITDKFGQVYYVDNTDTACELKVRGNATQAYQKLPFQLKLDTKTSILGMPEAKTWILLANYDDQSLLRNSVVYKIGAILGMDVCEFRSVDLYINGEYQGIYLLCEKVQIQENRVNIYDLEEEMETLTQPNYNYTQKVTGGSLIEETIITEYQYVAGINTPEDISGGYLVELDNNYYKSENCYFKTSNGNAYVIKSPENASKEQVQYIARVFAEMEEAFCSPTGKNSRGLHYSQYVDVDSFVYAYIIAELSRNWDAASSLYFYKDRDVNNEFSKIVKGPLWDCDNTLGNMLKGNANNTQTYWAKTRQFWQALTQHDYFNYRVAVEYEKVYSTLAAMAGDGGYIDQLVNELGTSIVMEQMRWQSNNYTFWPMYSYYEQPAGIHYDQWQSSQVFQFFEIYSNGMDNDSTTTIGCLKTFLKERTKWLHDEWSSTLENEEPSVSLTPIDAQLKPPMINITTPTPPIDSDTNSDIGSDTDTDTDTSVDTSTDTGIDTDSNINTDSSISTETNTETNTGTGSEPPKEDNTLVIALAFVSAVLLLAVIILVVVMVIKKK